MTDNATAAACQQGRPGRPPAPTGTGPGDGLTGGDRGAPAGHGQKAAVFLGQARVFLAEADDLLAGARSLLAESPVGGSAPAVAAPEGAGPGGSPPAGAETAMRYPSGRRRPTLRRVSVLVVAVAGLGLSIAGTAGLFSGSSSAGPGTNQAASYVNLPAVATRTDERRAVVPPAAAALPGAPTPVPLSVSVPRLRSSAAVVGEVSVQSGGPEKGLLTAPANYHQLGWYRHGSAGVLVIDGHVGFHQDPGPLAYIGELVPGDTVVVAFQGDARSYRVTGVARAVKGQLPATYFSQAYNDQVMLITCDYTSTFSGGHFADNVYVIASLR